MLLFHAGVGVELPFWPLSHFGSLKAALDRLKFRVQTKDDLRKVSLFEVTLKDEGMKFIDCADFGGAKPEAVTGVVLRDDDEARYKISMSIQEEIDRREMAGQAMTWPEQKLLARVMTAEAIAHRCDALRYPNKYEDTGGVSYCILQPNFSNVTSYPVKLTSERSAVIELGNKRAVLTLLDTPEMYPLPDDKVDKHTEVAIFERPSHTS